MFIKLIICEVLPDKKQLFSEAQKAWQLCKEANGFIGQVGGWSNVSNNTAILVGFWKNKWALEHFMATLHDQILHQNQQQDTYKNIHIYHFDYKIINKSYIKLKYNLSSMDSIHLDRHDKVQFDITFKKDKMFVYSNRHTNDTVTLIDNWTVI